MRTLHLTAMRTAEVRASRAEELRLLYVAMTRVRERLILVGTADLAASERRWESSEPDIPSRLPRLSRVANSKNATIATRTPQSPTNCSQTGDSKPKPPIGLCSQ